jgi:hypothetical protein
MRPEVIEAIFNLYKTARHYAAQLLVSVTYVEIEIIILPNLVLSLILVELPFLRLSAH